MKRLAKELCPPLLWNALRRMRSSLLPAKRRGCRVIQTLAALDEEIARVDRAGFESYAAVERAWESFRFEARTQLPANPHTSAYRDAVLATYREVSGRSAYTPEINEPVEIDVDSSLARPFPYSTGESAPVGERLTAAGFLISALRLRAGDRVLEFGPGLGNNTLEYTRIGCKVTALDINPHYLKLIGERHRRLGLEVTLVNADMTKFRQKERFNRVIFNACFHHCADHATMIERLGDTVVDGGKVIFGDEPIADDFPVPWGLRLDGQSAWAIRKYGWLELGFRTDYFLGLLGRHGWRAQRIQSRDAPSYKVYIARRVGEPGVGSN